MEKIIEVKQKTLKISYNDNALGLCTLKSLMFFCPDCADDNIIINQKYCGNCGQKLSWEL